MYIILKYSDASVNQYPQYLYSFCFLLENKKKGLDNVNIHPYTDGKGVSVRLSLEKYENWKKLRPTAEKLAEKDIPNWLEQLRNTKTKKIKGDKSLLYQQSSVCQL